MIVPNLFLNLIPIEKRQDEKILKERFGIEHCF